jgi:hypothetical protein
MGPDNLDFASFRELMLEAKKQGLKPNDLTSPVRLFNYLLKSGQRRKK